MNRPKTRLAPFLCWKRGEPKAVIDSAIVIIHDSTSFVTLENFDPGDIRE